jgi:hypothetical protein
MFFHYKTEIPDDDMFLKMLCWMVDAGEGQQLQAIFRLHLANQMNIPTRFQTGQTFPFILYLFICLRGLRGCPPAKPEEIWPTFPPSAFLLHP